MNIARLQPKEYHAYFCMNYYDKWCILWHIMDISMLCNNPAIPVEVLAWRWPVHWMDNEEISRGHCFHYCHAYTSHNIVRPQ